ncbi:MAG: Panacea domain-containing protein [Pontibacterium sp.]
MATLQDVAQCFLYLDGANDGDGISNLKLQKLAYYAQGFYSAIFNKPLFPEDIAAWTHGPVVPELYHQYKQFGSNPIPPINALDTHSLTKDEFELIEEVYEVFGQYSAWKLRNMTHEEPPWIDYEAEASVIPQKAITDYFKTRID